MQECLSRRGLSPPEQGCSAGDVWRSREKQVENGEEAEDSCSHTGTNNVKT